MKIILTGATGVVGTECVRLALAHPEVTEVVALSRRPVTAPDNTPSGADKTKLKTVLLEDFGSEYPEAIMEQLQGADGCIWNLALTPQRANALPPEEVKKISHDYPLIGLKAISSVANPDHPLRFVYTSGSMVERDQNKSLWLFPEYRKMRGVIESALLSHSADNDGKIEVQITKPGLIDHSGLGMAARAASSVVLMGTDALGVNVSQLAAAEVDQAVHGFKGKDTLENADLVGIGRSVLTELGIEKD